MAKTGKRLKQAYQGVDPTAAHPLGEAIELIKGRASAKFDETVEIAMNLNLDPRKPDQNLRGTVMLPHGTGKTVRVAVFARGDRAKEAEAAGADIVGAEDLAEKVQAGEIDFDRAIATPDMMSVVGRLGKILGPRGLMPNPDRKSTRLNSSHSQISYAVFCLKKKENLVLHLVQDVRILYRYGDGHADVFLVLLVIPFYVLAATGASVSSLEIAVTAVAQRAP